MIGEMCIAESYDVDEATSNRVRRAETSKSCGEKERRDEIGVGSIDGWKQYLLFSRNRDSGGGIMRRDEGTPAGFHILRFLSW